MARLLANTRRVALAAVCVAAALPCAGQAPAPRLLQAGSAAPDFTAKTPEGKKLRFSELRRGSAALVSFIVLPSDFCRWQLPHLQRAHERFAAAGLKVVAVDAGRQDRPAQVKSYWESNRLTFPVALSDPATDGARGLYRVTNYPTTYLIGKDGRVISAWAGFPRGNGGDRLKAELARAGFQD